MSEENSRRSWVVYGVVLMFIGLCGVLTAKIGDAWGETEGAAAVVFGWIFVFSGLATLVAGWGRRW